MYYHDRVLLELTLCPVLENVFITRHMGKRIGSSSNRNVKLPGVRLK